MNAGVGHLDEAARAEIHVAQVLTQRGEVEQGGVADPCAVEAEPTQVDQASQGHETTARYRPARGEVKF